MTVAFQFIHGVGTDHGDLSGADCGICGVILELRHHHAAEYQGRIHPHRVVAYKAMTEESR